MDGDAIMKLFRSACNRLIKQRDLGDLARKPRGAIRGSRRTSVGDPETRRPS
jgi:hypothetical protein